MKWRKDKLQVKDPTWIFSTWPIPTWPASLPFFITGTDAEDAQSSMRDIADLVYEGPTDYPKLQHCLERFDAIDGTVLIREGKFILPEALHIGSRINLTITGTRFLNRPSGPALEVTPGGKTTIVGNLFA